MKSRSAASFWPPDTIPNSAACLIALVVSPPALASPMTLAFDACACNRKEEKSEVLIGCLTPPSTLPPFAVTTAAVSRSSACPNAKSEVKKKPAVAAGLGQRLAGAVGEYVGGVGD